MLKAEESEASPKEIGSLKINDDDFQKTDK
jgi:hypothetical protein